MSRRKQGVRSEMGGHIGIEQRLLARLKRVCPDRDGLILVGFSGGPDSLALAAALGRVAPTVHLTVELIHVDHALRPSSADEARRAVELAHQIGLPCTIVRLDPDSISSHRGVGIEEAVRRERYRTFADAWFQRRARHVALAHHQSDQAETVLLHLLRGGGVHGAAAMAERIDLRVPWWSTPEPEAHYEVSIWRPFLPERRADVREYASRTGLSALEDPSNADLAIRRNAIREEILPLLEQVSPGATAALARYADLAAVTDDLLRTLAQTALEHARAEGGALRLAPLQTIHRAVAQSAIHAWLGSLRLDPTADRVEAVVDLISCPSRNRLIEVGKGRCVAVVDGQLVVQPCGDFATWGNRGR